MATGVLVLGINRATRLLGHLRSPTRRYDATVRLGVATTTDDAEGEVARDRLDATAVDRRRPSARRWPAFVGEIDQVPSAVSAIKVDGRRAYARVRAGEAGRARRRGAVTVHELEVHRRRSSGRASTIDGALLERHLRPRHRPRPRAAPRRRRPPDRAAAYGGRPVHASTTRRTLEQLGRRLRDDCPSPTPPARPSRPRPRRRATPRTSASAAALDLALDGPTALFAPDGEFLALYREGEDARARAVAVFCG